MRNEFRGNGNLADAPTLKSLNVDGEARSIAEMRVFFDRTRDDGHGGLADKGGFWLDVTVWNETLAERCARLLVKGARIHVAGELEHQSWTSKESGAEKSALQLHASEVYFGLARIESVTLRAPRTRESEAAAA